MFHEKNMNKEHSFLIKRTKNKFVAWGFLLVGSLGMLRVLCAMDMPIGSQRTGGTDQLAFGSQRKQPIDSQKSVLAETDFACASSVSFPVGNGGTNDSQSVESRSISIFAFVRDLRNSKKLGRSDSQKENF